MKIDDKEIEPRSSKPEEKLELMVAHKGMCKYCGYNCVKMFRDENLKLLPDQCLCFMCGQRYFMEIPDIKAWEIEQWKQKEEDL